MNWFIRYAAEATIDLKLLLSIVAVASGFAAYQLVTRGAFQAAGLGARWIKRLVVVAITCAALVVFLPNRADWLRLLPAEAGYCSEVPR